MGFAFFRRTPATGATAHDDLELHVEKTLQGAAGPLRLDVELRLARGQSMALLGPSGAGKTTLIRLLAGLERADRGHIDAFGQRWLDTAAGIDWPARRRRAGLMFQDYALFPHMTVRGNLRFALPRGRPARLADEWLERVGLAGLAERRPAQLSGGQQQRLALARTLAAEPSLLLLDEPLSALDADLRRDLQEHLQALRETQGLTLLMITHDLGEAVHLADRAVLLGAGRVRADVPPTALFGGPASPGLAGRVAGLTDAKGRCLVEAQGRLCLARPAQGSPLAVGDQVLLRADDWQAYPLAGTQSTSPSITGRPSATP